MEEVYMDVDIAAINADYSREVVDVGDKLLAKGREMPRPKFSTDAELLAYGMGLATAAQTLVSTHEKLTEDGCVLEQVFTYALAFITGAADAVRDEYEARHPGSGLSPTPSVRPS